MRLKSSKNKDLKRETGEKDAGNSSKASEGSQSSSGKHFPSPPSASALAERLGEPAFPQEKEGDDEDEEEVDANGFSHLEWSASVPYNLAEEPDEVCGMKHSHSCQSMPSVTLEQLSQQKSTATPSKLLDTEGDASEPVLKSIREIGSSEALDRDVRGVEPPIRRTSQKGGSRRGKVSATEGSESAETLSCQMEAPRLVRSLTTPGEDVRTSDPEEEDSRKSTKQVSESPPSVHAATSSTSPTPPPVPPLRRRSSATSNHEEEKKPGQQSKEDGGLSAPSVVSRVLLATTSAQPPMSLERQHSQAELNRKLEEVREKSRSTSRERIMLSQRPRARSEEAAKFPPERRPRMRLRSEGRCVDEDEVDGAGAKSPVEKQEGPSLPKKETATETNSEVSLNAPKLIRSVLGGPAGPSKEGPKQPGSSRPTTNPLPPPPAMFRDPPRRQPLTEGAGVRSASKERVWQIQKGLEERITQRRSQYDDLLASQQQKKEDLWKKRESASVDEGVSAARLLPSSNGEGDTVEEGEGRGGTVPVRRKLKEEAAAARDTSSMSRIEKRKQQQQQQGNGNALSKIRQQQLDDDDGSYFLVERTGDWMETKSLPVPKSGAGSQGGKRNRYVRNMRCFFVLGHLYPWTVCTRTIEWASSFRHSFTT